METCHQKGSKLHYVTLGFVIVLKYVAYITNSSGVALGLNDIVHDNLAWVVD